MFVDAKTPSGRSHRDVESVRLDFMEGEPSLISFYIGV